MSILAKAAKIGIITLSLGLSALVGCAKKETVKTTPAPAPAAEPKPTDGTAAGSPTSPAVAAPSEPAPPREPMPTPAPSKHGKK